MSEPDNLRNALYGELVRASGLELQGDFAGGIRVLQEFLDRHSVQDRDGWLRNAVRFHQGCMIQHSGDMEDALRMFRSVETRPEDRLFCLLNSYCIADLLDDMGREREAYDELSHRLRQVGGPPDKSDLKIVTLYIDLATRVGEGFPADAWDLVRNVVHEWGIQVPESQARNPEALIAALDAANERFREAAVHERRRLDVEGSSTQ
jgi:hypothetical protein